MRTVTICLWLLLPLTSAADEPAKPKYEPTSNYPPQDIQGWTVYVNYRLLEEEKELGRRVLELLKVKLYDIKRAVPAKALSKLHEIPIWVELKHPRHRCACYHPDKKWLIANNFNPEKVGSVEIANAATFLKWTPEQPSMLLHALAHGYHDLYLGGYDNREIAAAYRRAVESRSYESVLHWDGKMVRAYALNNPQEYFAELTEAWFGSNDFYPFVRAEVIKHDPETAKVLKTVWGE